MLKLSEAPAILDKGELSVTEFVSTTKIYIYIFAYICFMISTYYICFVISTYLTYLLVDFNASLLVCTSAVLSFVLIKALFSCRFLLFVALSWFGDNLINTKDLLV